MGRTPSCTWLKKSPLLDGSGTIKLENGEVFNIAVHDIVVGTHRVAFRDGEEVARAKTFPSLLRKLIKVPVSVA